MNLEQENNLLDLSLTDPTGALLATAQIALKALGHRARFVNEIDWQIKNGVELDLSSFQGLLKVTSDGRMAATVLQTREGVLATLPVIPDLDQM
jgi:hypothetical protein